MRLTISILGILGSMVVAAEPTAEEAHRPLTAVSKREAYVFASTPAGLFRAPLKTKRWERLKTPPGMPLNGTFASQPARSSLIIYVALRSRLERKPRPGLHYGLYISRDNGDIWELVAERDDFGATLHHPSGALFSVVGDDGINRGSRLLRSPDLGKTWRDITGNAGGQFMSIEPDPDHTGLVRIQAWAIRMYTIEADDETYRWKFTQEKKAAVGRIPSDKFFSRESSSTNRFYCFAATLSNYFRYDFGDQTQVQALEVVPRKDRFEFARKARVIVPVRVVFHFDPETRWPNLEKAANEGDPLPNDTAPKEKLADRPGETTFWGLRIETADSQSVKYSADRRYESISVDTNIDGKSVTTRSQPPAVKFQVFELSPPSPYEREIDLGHIADFTRPGEYRVQIVYDSGGHPHGDESVWDGHFTSPVFTVVIRE